MRKKFFLKNLGLFLILLFIPTVILGGLSILITKQYIKDDLYTDNYLLLNQIKKNMELIIEELEPLKLAYGINGQTTYYSKKLLNSQSLEYIDINSLKIINNSLSSLSNAREYIHSIYIYFKNKDNYFLTGNTKEKIGMYFDSGWYESYLQNRETRRQWSERRLIALPGGNHQEVVSIYNLLGTTDSVIVFNIVPQYIDKLLQSGIDDAGQKLLIINEDKEILFGDSSFLRHEDKNLLFGKLDNRPEKLFEIQFTADKFIGHKVISDKNGWKYLLFSPKSQVFKVYYNLLNLIMIMLVGSVLVGIVLSVYFTRQSTKQVYKIIDIIQAAENNQPLPSVTPQATSTYGYIVQNILKTFINQSFLKAQLEARKYKLRSAQLMALQTQINPHFLFNTLETINWKVYQFTKKPNEVNEMLEYLSELLRYSLESPEEEVTLREEIENTKRYVYLQKIRYKEKFAVIWDYRESVLEVKVPKLILQPLIENAIYHGIKSSPDKGLIKIRVRTLANEIKISVIDNGAGMAKEKLHLLRDKLNSEDVFDSKHIGLTNINTRLRLKYGKKLSIRSKKHWGTAVGLSLPVEGEKHVQSPYS